MTELVSPEPILGSAALANEAAPLAAASRSNRAMRVLFLAPQPFFQDRGTPIAERALLQLLAEREYEVDVLTYPEGENLDLPRCAIRRIPALPGLTGIRPGFSPKKVAADLVMLGRCLAMLRGRRYDLIHAVEEAAFIALVAKRVFGIPYVYDMDSSLPQQMTEQAPWLRPARWALDRSERVAIKESIAVLAVCKSLEDIARGHDSTKLIGRAEDVSLIGDDVQTGERLREVVAATGPLVLYVGNLEPYQGIDLLVEGFQRALSQVDDAHLVVIGGTANHRSHYMDECARLGIADRVHFLGPRPLDHLGWYLRQADVLVSPRTQGLNTPMKVYSYLESGCPVVATRLRTHTQVLDDEIAYLVDPTPDGLGDGIARLLADEPLRRRLADRARARVQAEFTPEAFRRKVHRFYDAVERRMGRLDA